MASPPPVVLALPATGAPVLLLKSRTVVPPTTVSAAIPPLGSDRSTATKALRATFVDPLAGRTAVTVGPVGVGVPTGAIWKRSKETVTGGASFLPIARIIARPTGLKN